MPEEKGELIVVIVIIILILLFFGVVFLIMVIFYNSRKLAAAKEKQQLKDNFEKQLLQSRLEVQDEIMNHISQEIHDNVGQILSLAKLQINVIDESGVFNKERITDLKESVSRALHDLREIAKSMNSQRVQQSSIEELVDAELSRINKTGFTNTSLHITGLEKDFAYRGKLILFRIIQECLQNIIKHANATEIKVNIAFNNEQMVIDIRDNGIGFNIDDKQEKGMGLQNIINRTTLINGKVSFNSVINAGTTIHITVPTP